MKILPVNQAFDQSLQILQMGGTIILPTETCYGLSCDALNPEAVRTIFVLKGRTEKKSVLVLVSSIKMAKEYLVWSPKLEELSSKFWPGPLTIVGKANPDINFPPEVVDAQGFLGLRVTAYPFLQNLISQFGRPIVSTSANLAGEQNLYTSQEVISVFGDMKPFDKLRVSSITPDQFVDAGDLPMNKPTTLVKIESEIVTVLRPGEVEV